MNSRQLAIGVTAAAAVFLLAACAEQEGYAPIAAAGARGTIAAAQAAESAARAELERHTVALTAAAQSTTTAQENSARATRVALDTRATTQALDALATTQARSIQATVTAESRNAIAQATAEMATATMQAAVDSVEGTRQAAQAVILEATANAVKRQDEMDEAVWGVRAAAPWVGLATAVVIAIGLLIYFAPVVKARNSVIRRRRDEAEPYLVTNNQVVAIARLFSPLLDLTAQSAPQLAPPELQDRATARAQLANVVNAARGASRRLTKQQTRAPGAAAPSVIRVIEPEQARTWIQDARAQLIEQGVADGDL